MLFSLNLTSAATIMYLHSEICKSSTRSARARDKQQASTPQNQGKTRIWKDDLVDAATPIFDFLGERIYLAGY